MKTGIGRVAKVSLILLCPIIVILFVKLEPALTGGGELTVILFIGGCITAIPLALIGIPLACAIELSKSRFALLYYPVIGGLVAAACVPHLIHANLSAHLFRRYGIVYGLVGLVIGGLAFLISASAARHSAKYKPHGDSKEMS